MNIEKQTIVDIYTAWEQDFRDGKTPSIEESLTRPVEEVARDQADYMWSELQKRHGNA